MHDEPGVGKVFEEERARRMIGVGVRVDEGVELEALVGQHGEIPLGTGPDRIDQCRTPRARARDEIGLTLSSVELADKHVGPLPVIRNGVAATGPYSNAL
jgi:hypothetical protein